MRHKRKVLKSRKLHEHNNNHKKDKLSSLKNKSTKNIYNEDLKYKLKDLN